MKKILKAFSALSLATVLTITPVYAAENNYQTSIIPVENVSLIFYSGTEKTDAGLEEFTYVCDSSLSQAKDYIMVEPYLVAETIEKTSYIKARSGLHFRTFPNIKYSNVYKTLPYRSAVKVIGISDTGWALVEMDDQTVFCWEEYLSDEQPPIIKQEKKL